MSDEDPKRLTDPASAADPRLRALLRAARPAAPSEEDEIAVEESLQQTLEALTRRDSAPHVKGRAAG